MYTDKSNLGIPLLNKRERNWTKQKNRKDPQKHETVGQLKVGHSVSTARHDGSKKNARRFSRIFTGYFPVNF